MALTDDGKSGRGPFEDFVPRSGFFGPLDESQTDYLCRFKGIPLFPANKTERLGKCADFSFISYARALRDGYAPSKSGQDTSFQVVDNRSNKKPVVDQAWTRRKQPKHTAQAFQQKQEQERLLTLGRKKLSEQKKHQAAIQARYQRLNQRARGHGDWSVEAKPSWTPAGEILLSQLSKQQVSGAVQMQVVCRRGRICEYDKNADRVMPTNPRLLETKKLPEIENPTTDSDDILRSYVCYDPSDSQSKEELPKDGKVPGAPLKVAITDQILCVLMSAASSRYSWHLWISKVEGKLIFDKYDDCKLDLNIYNETGPEDGGIAAQGGMTNALVIAQEAAKVNNAVKQALVIPGKVVESFGDSPFVHRNAPVEYAYKIFSIPPLVGADNGLLDIVTRTELNAKLGDSYVGLCAFNEFVGSKGRSWRNILEGQKGAILVTEMRNNANKLQKFVASAMLNNCDECRMVFTTRKRPSDMDQHEVLSVQVQKTEDLLKQMEWTSKLAWGSLRAIADYFMVLEDGRYVIVKDPMKHVLRVYHIAENDLKRADEYD